MLEIYIWISFEILSHCLFLFSKTNDVTFNELSLLFCFLLWGKRGLVLILEKYIEKRWRAGWTEEREEDGIVSSAVKYHVLLLRTETFLPMFLGKLSHQYHLFFPSVFLSFKCWPPFPPSPPLARLFTSWRICGAQTFVVRSFAFFLWGVDTDFFVNNNSCHWLPCPWLLLPWFLSDKSHIVPHVLALLLADISPLLFLSHHNCSLLFCFSSLVWSDWGIIAKLNTFRAIAHFFPHSLPVMSELFKGLFHRACWPHASPACDWLTLFI